MDDRPKDEREEDQQRRAKFVRLILVTMAAGIVAAGFSLTLGSGDSDVVTAAKATLSGAETEQDDGDSGVEDGDGEPADDGIVDLIELAEPYELIDDDIHLGTTTVGAAKSLATIPIPLLAITSAQPPFDDDATIELTVDIQDGLMTGLSASIDPDTDTEAGAEVDSIVVDFDFPEGKE